SQNIHQNDKTSSRMGKKPQDQTFYLPRRHRTYSNYTSNISETQLQDQHDQVQPKSQRSKKRIFSSNEETNNIHKKVNHNNWKALSHYWCNSSIKIKNSMANKRQKPSLDETRLKHPSEIVAAEHLTTRLVDHKLGELCTESGLAQRNSINESTLDTHSQDTIQDNYVSSHAMPN
ncbi:32288_t:CDS:2, partial [Racocetra persica]